MVVFDGDSNEAPMYALHPDGALGEGLLPISVGVVETGGMLSNGVGSVVGMSQGVET
jgi:ubiquitin-like 1-activating enzyme E1 A